MILVNDPDAGDLTAEIAGTTYIHGHDVSFSNHRADGSYLGGTILKDYTGASMALHEGGRGEHWLSRDLLWITFHHPFVQLGCTSLIGYTPDYNTAALSLALKVGFEIETRIKDCLPGGGSLVVTRMWRDRCRWLSLRPRSVQDTQALLAPGGFA